MLFVVMVRVVRSHPLVPGIGGFHRIYMAFISGFLIPWDCKMISLNTRSYWCLDG